MFHQTKKTIKELRLEAGVQYVGALSRYNNAIPGKTSRLQLGSQHVGALFQTEFRKRALEEASPFVEETKLLDEEKLDRLNQLITELEHEAEQIFGSECKISDEMIARLIKLLNTFPDDPENKIRNWTNTFGCQS